MKANMEGQIRKSNLFDSNEQLDHASHLHGGTFITNFSYDSIYDYDKAIKELKKIDPKIELVISGFAYNMHGEPIAGYSLHKISNTENLSDFWAIYDKIKKDEYMDRNQNP